MNPESSDAQAIPRPPTTPAPSGPRHRPGWRALLAERSVQITVLAWVAINVAILLIARGKLPFDRPLVADRSFGQQLLFANLSILPVFLLMAVTYALTRRRAVPDLAARAPERATARRETLLLVAYGIAAQLLGVLLGRMLGWHAFSFHLVGTIYGTHHAVEPAEVVGWCSYNFAAYAIVPFLVFRFLRGYSAEALNLKSSNRRNDVLVILVILALESADELVGLSSAIFKLQPSQLLAGVPLTFLVYFLGTVLPTMVFIYCILLPRYLKLTASVATTVILGGLTYALLHFFDGWTVFTSPGTAVLSVCFLLLQYTAPGMIKSYLTLRTGNAWVHVWAYHAIDPHVLVDTPLLVRIFRL